MRGSPAEAVRRCQPRPASRARFRSGTLGLAVRRWPIVLRCDREASDVSKLSRMRKSLIRGGLQLSENSKAQLRSRRIEFRLTQPIGQPVPSGENLGHHLQVVDFKRLKSPTHSVDRTAVATVRLLAHELRSAPVL